ncbi:acetyltransferase, GNAT family [Moelleriella libera RCEF 2490]|uniref:Acetyltransferase, GNAT family n=1 Tax=Moelleriella libera RCEF 2490 TaxID=1081109 RepID=A0A166UG97_9HYPO|nr:acetyltransferase, GNAT family [Moelleriella libera RCEF 2490]
MAVPASSRARPSSAETSSKSSVIPELSFGVLTKVPEKQDAMRLVTDSIAQQRQIASFSVIVHPACLVGLVAGCTSVWRLNADRDFGTALMMVCGLILAYLAAVRLLTANYIRLAESMRWTEWIASPHGEDDYILAARFGEEIIATLVLRLLPPADSSQKTRSSSLKGGSAIIRAWTTKQRYRGKGVGGDMLRLAILTTRSRCGGDAQISFDTAHANSARPLHDMFNRPFNKREKKARAALEHALAACDRGDSTFEIQ